MERVATKPARMVFRALEDFRCEIDGEIVEVSAGEMFAQDHEIVNANLSRFESSTVLYEIEQMTAAPGERRER